MAHNPTALFLPALLLLVSAAACVLPTGPARVGGRFFPPESYVNDTDASLRIPAGEFAMGSDEAMAQAPQHKVFVDAFYIDKYEVTNARYQDCVDAGACTAPRSAATLTRRDYYGNPEFADFPVVNVDWTQASTFCAWEDKRLPTEAEWEKAARGDDARVYPWGNESSASKLNYWIGTPHGFQVGDTAPVGYSTGDTSPYGVMTMAGNVSEWVNDWYAEDYYGSAPPHNPSGPEHGESRVIRGGCWWCLPETLHVTWRRGGFPDGADYTTGFRCVRATDEPQATLAVATAGDGTGRVVSDPVSIDCGDACQVAFPAGITLTLTATPDPDSLFAGWQGACSGDAPVCALTLDAAASATAVFSLRPVAQSTVGGFRDETPIPGGDFLMGSSDADIEAALAGCSPGADGCTRAQLANETPQHAVHLAAFLIDTFEVTNARYQACVDAGVCTAPTSSASETRARYFGNPDYADFPVIFVDWDQAAAFCAWEGKRLPTEAEWEMAARGVDGRRYPWGNQAPDCTLANFAATGDQAGCADDTRRVGSYPAGASPEGVMDMAGNVWEWTSDWYAEDYYTVALAAHPTGPDSGSRRAVRGGAWINAADGVRAANRNSAAPSDRNRSLGFRCARTP